MGIETIYEKRYPHRDVQDRPTLPALPKEPTGVFPSFDEISQKIKADTTYVIIPERMRGSEAFIRTAIEASRLYELDIRVERHDSHISVIYSFNCGGGMREIGKVFGMADEFAFFRDIYGFDLTISMDYYTHRMIRGGRTIAPEVG